MTIHMHMNQYIDNLNWRYATKKFDPTKKLTAEQLDMLCESLRLAPSSSGLQPWKFFCITDEQTRKELFPISDEQNQVIEASVLFVIASRINFDETDIDRYIARVAEVRDVTIESLAKFRQSRIDDIVVGKSVEERDSWSARQSYIALGFLLSCAAQNGIDVCPMEGFDAQKVTEYLGADKEGYVARAYCAVGFRDESDSLIQKKKVRFSTEQVIKKI